MTMVRLDDLAGMYEVCQIVQFTDARVHQLRVEGRFPEPVYRVKATPLWLISEVQEWKRTYVPKKPGRPRKGESDVRPDLAGSDS
jgi:predicted DNA-binding transcriptional regulator AlpA